MMKENFDYKEISKLLYEVTLEYEDKIVNLKNENDELKRKLNSSLIFKLEKKYKSFIKMGFYKIINGLKYLITVMGLKETIKKFDIYKKIKKKLGD